MAKKKSGGHSGGRISQYTEDQQIDFVKNVEGKSGAEKEEAARKYGISIQTYWNWKKKWGHLVSKSARSHTPPTNKAVVEAVQREVMKPSRQAIDQDSRALKHKLIETIMQEDRISTLKEKTLKILLDY